MPLALVGSELQVLSWNGRGIVVHRTKEFHEQSVAILAQAILAQAVAILAQGLGSSAPPLFVSVD